MHWSRAGAAALRPYEWLTRRRSTVSSMLASSTRPPSLSSDSMFATRRWRLRRGWAGSGALQALATADTELEAQACHSLPHESRLSQGAAPTHYSLLPFSAHLHERQQDIPVTARRRGWRARSSSLTSAIAATAATALMLKFTHFSLKWL